MQDTIKLDNENETLLISNLKPKILKFKIADSKWQAQIQNVLEFL